MFLYSLVANFAHPVTPTLIKDLGLHDYMFGLAFACMSLANFMFSPMWGKICSKLGPGKVYSAAFLGYGLMQFIFGLATQEWHICLARFGGGFFISAISVGQMVYVIKNSPNKGKHLAFLATLNAVTAPFGFLIGGFIGDYTIRGTFYIQAVGLALIGVLGMFILGDSDVENVSMSLKEMNPLAAFVNSRDLIKGYVVFFLITVACSAFASTCYEQCFNYYIKDQFNFPSSYNGILKAGVGFIALAAYYLVTMRLLKTNTYKTITFVFATLFAMLVLVILFNDMIPFIIINVVFFGCNSIYAPLQQDKMTKRNKARSSEMAGLYNATSSIGMVIGSLSAGFIYAYGPKLSFVFSAIAFFVCIFVSIGEFNIVKNLPVEE